MSDSGLSRASFVPAYTPLERVPVPRPVERIAVIKQVCKDRVVLDLGAMDETAYIAKKGRGTWLHDEIASVATEVAGIDSSSILPPNGLRTRRNAMIYAGDIMALDSWLQFGPKQNQFSPDVIIAGELIEHLQNPLMFLQKLKSISSLSGKTLIITTPNATAIHNCLIGFVSRESTHHDHLCILSFKTLSTLCNRAGFAAWKIAPYYSQFSEIKARQTGLKRLLVEIGEKVINGLEWAFPMLSFGYIVTIEI